LTDITVSVEIIDATKAHRSPPHVTWGSIYREPLMGEQLEGVETIHDPIEVNILRDCSLLS
jgi:hypothetical protein